MKPTQAILPVAGLGTRFLPWTKAVPKEMLPIGTVPIISLLVDQCLSVGITDICFVISKGKEAIVDYFAHDEELIAELVARGKSDALDELSKYDAVRFSHVFQDEQKGDGHAILQAVDFVHSDAIAILFGDDLIMGAQNGLQQLVSCYEDGALLSLQNVPREEVSQYGIADVEEGDRSVKVIRGLVEKPDPADAPSTFGIVGQYIIPRSLFETLPSVSAGHGGEIRLIDALMSQIGSMPIRGLVCEGERYDTGTPAGYRHAVLSLGA